MNAISKRLHIHVGMRVIKTVVAVFLCCVIDYVRGAIPFQSTIAAILCMQQDTENTINIAISRALGTLIGGFCAALCLMLFVAAGIPTPSILFFFILSLLLIPLIYIPVQLGWPSATALTCIVFLVISLGYTGEQAPLVTAGVRMLDTLVGIGVALPINLLLPNNAAQKQTENEQTDDDLAENPESEKAMHADSCEKAADEIKAQTKG